MLDVVIAKATFVAWKLINKLSNAVKFLAYVSFYDLVYKIEFKWLGFFQLNIQFNWREPLSANLLPTIENFVEGLLLVVQIRSNRWSSSLEQQIVGTITLPCYSVEQHRRRASPILYIINTGFRPQILERKFI